MDSFDVAVLGGGSAGYAAARTAHDAGARVAIIDQGRIIQNTTVKNLLKQLNKETFIIDTKDKVDDCPMLSGYPITMLDEHTLEVSVERDQSVNQLFKLLSEQAIEVVSMRNKANRLEELFFNLVEKNLSGEQQESNHE